MSDASDLDRLINERLEALLPKKLAGSKMQSVVVTC